MYTYRKHEILPGDLRESPPDIAVGDQPLTSQQRQLLKRGEALFRFFHEKLREEHRQMEEARRMRHFTDSNQSTTSPPGNTLGSCVDNVIADQVDNMPEAFMIPEREETAYSAEEMTDVVSFVLDQTGWTGKYNALMEDTVVTGTGVAQVFWDDDAMDGEGMVSVMSWHPEDFYPDPMYENIQDGRGCFKVTHTTVAWIEEHYPHARGYVRADRTHTENIVEEMMDAPQGDEPTTLIEFWYKRYDAQKHKNRIHMAQFAGGALLYASEFDFGTGEAEGTYREGIYAHGLYPFVLYKYRSVWRRPFGTGLVYDYALTQKTIDRYAKYIDDNARASSVQRMFVRRGSGINPEDVADMRKTIIEWDGNDIREVLQIVQANPLNGQVYEAMQRLMESMKQDCGQNQFTRGEAGLGVTAASAIQALQDAGNKLTRWHGEQCKFSFQMMVEQILWLLSEYMTPGRKLRIVGGWDSTGNMVDRFIELIAPDKEGDALPRPAYTVRVQVQKHNPMQIQADNEFLKDVAKICAEAGAPLPPEAVVRLMEGYRTKNSVLRAVEENGQQIEQMKQMQAQLNQDQQTIENQKRMQAEYIKSLLTQTNERKGQ